MNKIINWDNPITINNNIFRSYFIGSIEVTGKGDNGAGWRTELTPKFNSRGIYCFDPVSLESKKIGMPQEDFLKKIVNVRKNGRMQFFMENMEKIWKGLDIIEEENGKLISKRVLGDLGYTLNSDFLVFNLHQNDKPGGSIIEMAYAHQAGIPTYLITEIPLYKLNSSILYFILDSGRGQGGVFKSQGDLLEFIDEKYNLKEQKNYIKQ
jgi:hypothetical protein